MLNTRNTLGTRAGTSARSTFVGGLMALTAIVVLVVGADAQESGSQAEAQENTVFGLVVDSETRAPLVGAWVGLSGTEWGSISNPDGRFRIPDHGAGRLDLTIEMLGYRTQNWSGEVGGGQEVVIGLDPEPILLEGLEVMTDRFESRRKAAATTVLAFDSNDLTRSTTMNALDFIAAQSGVFLSACNGARGSSCVWYRGRLIEPVVYVDEFPHVGGLDYLASFSPAELHMVEVYNRGTQIRVYTPAFMKRAAEHRIVPIPITTMGVRR